MFFLTGNKNNVVGGGNLGILCLCYETKPSS